MSQPTAALLHEILTLPVADRLDRLRREPDPQAALLALGDEAEQLAISDLAGALSAGEALCTLADRSGWAAAQSRARRALAQALAYANRFDDAIAALDQARRIAAATGVVPLETARVDLASLHALGRRGRFDEALQAGERARAAFAAAGERVLAARADVNTGVVRRMRDDPAGAILHFDRARPDLHDQPMIRALLDSNRAEALLDLNRFTDAEAAFQSALDYLESAGASRAASIVIGNLADLMSRQGRLDRAVRYFERARQRLGDQAPGDQARLAAEQSEALAAIGAPEEAASLYEQALPALDASGLAAEAARARAGLGRVLARLGRTHEATRHLRAAVEGFEALGHPSGAARARAAWSEVLATQGDEKGARRLLTESLRTLAGRPADAAAARLLLTDLALRAGDLPAAEAELTPALDAAMSLDIAPVLADAWSACARVRRAQGRANEASGALRRALEQTERVRGTLQARPFRAAFLGGRADVYEACFSDALDRGDAPGLREAFRIAELAKSRTLLDLLQGGLALGAEGDAPEGLEPLARIRAELNALYTWLDDAVSRGSGSLDPHLRDRIRQAERSIDAMESGLAATARFGSVFGAPAEADAVLGDLPDSTAIIEFFQESDRLTALVLARGGVRVWRALVRAGDARDMTERIHFQAGRALARGLAGGPAAARLLDDVRRELNRMHEALVAPLTAALEGIERVFVAPHGALHAAPLHALWSGASYWVERSEIVYAPSVSVLQRLRAGKTPGPRDAPAALIVGVSRDDLPAIDAEVQRLREVMPRAVVLSGPGATREAFAAGAARAGLVHVASHARMHLPDPLASGFELTDGWFTVRDAYGLRLPGSAVVLSGCDTGRAVVRAGDELVGLAHGFLAGGARALIVSQWAAHDRITAELMAQAYRMWYAGSGSIGSALRSAQLLAIRDQAHPAGWAAFFSIGDA